MDYCLIIPLLKIVLLLVFITLIKYIPFSNLLKSILVILSPFWERIIWPNTFVILIWVFSSSLILMVNWPLFGFGNKLIVENSWFVLFKLVQSWTSTDNVRVLEQPNVFVPATLYWVVTDGETLIELVFAALLLV